jgi:hypothetical protein
MALDGAGKTAPSGSPDDFNAIAVGKRSTSTLSPTLASPEASSSRSSPEIPRWGHAAASLRKMTAHRQGHAFQTNRLVFD